MSRRFLHRWFGHWSLMLLAMTIILAVLYGATRMELLAGALITAAFSLAMVALGWFATREA